MPPVCSSRSFLILLFVAGLTVGLGGPASAQLAPSGLTPLPLDDLSAFRPPDAENWRIVGRAAADRTVERQLDTSPGTGVLANTETEPGEGANLFTRLMHGDVDLELDYLMPSGSNSGVYLQGRYEIQLFDSWGVDPPQHSDAAGIYQRWDEARPDGEKGYEGHPPALNVSRAPGLWQHLRIVFRAPRFDDSGQKTENARFLEVYHNGTLVHEDVELTGPTRAAAFDDEAAEGPIMLQGDHGPVAFRNVRYKLHIPERLRITDLRYTYAEGDWDERPDVRSLEPRASGEVDAIDWSHLQSRSDFALVYDGTLQVPEGGTYTFDLAAVGDARLFVRGQPVVRFERELPPEQDGDAPSRRGSLYLTAGEHPIRVEYVKRERDWLQPRLFLNAEGSAMPWHALSTAPASYADEAPVPMPVEVGDTPYLFRAFIRYDGEKRTHAMAVGDPTGIHYAVDIEGMDLLYLWKGDFLDARPMWHERGEAQTPLPIGTPLVMSGLPTVASLDGPTAPWPDSLDTFEFEAYTLDDEGHPTFTYSVDGVEVSDSFLPREDGRFLRRTLTFEADADQPGLWVLLARSNDGMEENGQTTYRVGDGAYYVEVHEGVATELRNVGGAVEAVAPVRLENGRATITYDLVW